jgi:hypothetical protein
MNDFSLFIGWGKETQHKHATHNHHDLFPDMKDDRLCFGAKIVGFNGARGAAGCTGATTRGGGLYNCKYAKRNEQTEGGQ